MTWRSSAACLGMDPNLFFGTENVKTAKEVCRLCQVIDECLDDAIDQSDWGDYAGIRGGVGPDERRRLRKRRRRSA